MLKYIVKRIVLMIPVLIIMSIIVFPYSTLALEILFPALQGLTPQRKFMKV